MKKSFLFLMAFVAVCTIAPAQYYYYTNAAPWDGDKAYSLNVGGDFSLTPRNFGDNVTNLRNTPGLAASLRYEGSKNFNESLSWGYQIEGSYLSQGFSFQQNKDIYSSSTPIPTTQFTNINWWDGQIDMRLSLSYWINDQIELQLAAGIYFGLLYGIKGEHYSNYAGTNLEVPNSREEVNVPLSIFSFDMGVSTLFQAKYFFNENFFVSLSVRDNIGLDIFKEASFGSDNSIFGRGGQRGIAMVGVGYKFIK